MRTDNLEFIEINELKKDVETWRERARRLCPLRNVNRIPIRELYEILEGLPIAKGEVLRTQGHWEEINDGGWAGGGYLKCSACGYGVSWDLSDAADLKYCPYCGARMEAEEC